MEFASEQRAVPDDHRIMDQREALIYPPITFVRLTWDDVERGVWTYPHCVTVKDN